MAVNVLVPLLIPLGEQITNFSSNGENIIFEESPYRVEVNENLAPIKLLTVKAKTNVSEVNVRYSLAEGDLGHFVVDSKSGDISLISALDYELQKEHQLTVAAKGASETTFGKVLIQVRDLNDNPPRFLRPLYETQITEEDDRYLPKAILQVDAIDPDESNRNRLKYALTGEGVYRNASKMGFFSIEEQTGHVQLLKPLDRDPPLGRSKWILTVGVSDGKYSSRTRLHINVKDINDNPPSFVTPFMRASIKENSVARSDVIQVKAFDRDDPNEGSHAVIRYSIEKNVIDEDVGLSIFDMDSESGRIRTTLCCLDREKTAQYAIQVVATDGGGLKGTGSVLVTVEDENDTKPQFSRKDWKFAIHESAPVNQTLALLSVDDFDLINDFYFKIVNDSGYGWDLFGVRLSGNSSCSLYAISALDYEDPSQRSGFHFQVQVSDMGSDLEDISRIDTSWVSITLVDDNDNKPKFDQPFINLTLREDFPINISLTKFSAHDLDNSGKNVLKYSIDSISDEEEIFTIGNSGSVYLNRALDRETKDLHRIRVLVEDSGVPSLTSTSLLQVFINDINDNPPFVMQSLKVTVKENKEPGIVAELLLSDPDDWMLGHGPPFSVRLLESAPAKIKEAFAVDFRPDCDQKRGCAVIRTLIPLDREEGSVRLIPIFVSDKEGVRGTSTVTVVIADENDNIMAPGKKFVSVTRIESQTEGEIFIGRVYVQDPDDWDVNDKFWSLQQEKLSKRSHLRQKVRVNSRTGEVFLDASINDGEYLLPFYVNDKRRQQYNVIAEILVKVSTFSADFLQTTVPLKITSHSARNLISQDKDGHNILERLLHTLEEFTNNSLKMLSLNSNEENMSGKNIYDTWLWISGTAKFSMDQFLFKNKQTVSEKANVVISSVGFESCTELYSDFINGTNSLKPRSAFWTVDANKTAMVTPILRSIRSCLCKTYRSHSNRIPPLKKESSTKMDEQMNLAHVKSVFVDSPCQPGHCLNSGRCIPTTDGTRCVCPFGTYGERCKILSRYFNSQNWAWHHPLPLCGTYHISLEFKTNALDGILLYSGPEKYSSAKQHFEKEVLSLYLKNGRLKLLLEIGQKFVFLSSFLNDTFLSDGKWHRIDLVKGDSKVELLVDLCQTKSQECYLASLWSYRSKSSSHLNEPPITSFRPLQIGGLAYPIPSWGDMQWPEEIPSSSFSGCLKNIRVNGKLLDLGNDITSDGSYSPCPDDETCRLMECPENSRCVHTGVSLTCECAPGWTGKKCDRKTTPSYFNSLSYVKIALSFTPSSESTSFQLRYCDFCSKLIHGKLGMFRTWSHTGALLALSSQHNRDAMLLYFKDGKLCLYMSIYMVQEYRFDLCLNYISLNDGEWHKANIKRYGHFAEIWVDHSDWPSYNSSLSDPSCYFYGLHVSKEIFSKAWFTKALLLDLQEGVYVGGKPQFDGVSLFSVNNDFVKGCIDDIRLNGRQLPLSPGANATASAQITSFSNVYKGCPSPNMCHNVTCPSPLKCVNLWNKQDCRCEYGKILSLDGSVCDDLNECQWSPCFNGGVCNNLSPNYICSCPAGYLGKNCEIQSSGGARFHLPTGAILAACVWGFLFLALSVACFAYYLCYKSKMKGTHKLEGKSKNCNNANSKYETRSDVDKNDRSPYIIPVESGFIEKKCYSQTNLKNSEKIKNEKFRRLKCKKKVFFKEEAEEEAPSPYSLISLSGNVEDLRYYASEGTGNTLGSFTLSSFCSGNNGTSSYSNEDKLFHEVSNTPVLPTQQEQKVTSCMASMQADYIHCSSSTNYNDKTFEEIMIHHSRSSRNVASERKISSCARKNSKQDHIIGTYSSLPHLSTKSHNSPEHFHETYNYNLQKLERVSWSNVFPD